MAGITAILWNQAEALLVVTVLTCGECLITCFADSHLASLAAQVHSVSVRCILLAPLASKNLLIPHQLTTELNHLRLFIRLKHSGQAARSSAGNREMKEVESGEVQHSWSGGQREGWVGNGYEYRERETKVELG
eukprot:TRINITY_DN3956_c0_g1_i10.p1 TRINITY_DN3956_c0_g1~~TRINITY_DN3956_c0_g1_i10.p1  ORF type:complete len:134 (-),score=4.91 TRINITY_DN3956_c0_g1_i10:249-650(-)